MVRLVLPFATGLFLADQLDWSCPLPVLLVGLLILTISSLFDLSSGSRQVYGVFWILWVMLAGTSWLKLHHPLEGIRHWQHQINDTTAVWQGSIREVRQGERWQRLTVEIGKARVGPVWKDNLHGKMLVYVPSEQAEARVSGEVVTFSGQPTPVPPAGEPFGFDWRRYLFVRGITHQVFLKEAIEVLDSGSTWMARFSRARSQLEGQLDHLIPEARARQLLQAILLGARDDLGEDLNQAYQASGAVHILAVSGLHVGLVAGCCLFLLGWLLPGRRRQLVVALPTVLMVWAYVLLTGAADSALRAGVLFSFLILGRSLSRYAEAINLLAAAVIVLLLYDPWMIFHVGFQLSVLAVAGILLLQPVIFRAWVPPDRVTRFFWNLTAVTIAAQLATLFLSLYYFHQFPVYFLLAGWFVVPLSGAVLAGGWAILLLHQILPGLALTLAWIPSGLATIMNALVFAIASLPSALSTDWSPAPWWAVLVPICAGALIHGWVRRQASGLILALSALAVGLGLDAWAAYERQALVQWGVVRRQGNGPEILLREDGATTLLDLTGERQMVEQQTLPGYGPTWLVPGSIDFQFGFFHKSNTTIRRGSRHFGWDDEVSYDILLAPPRYPARQENIEDSRLVLLPWQMKPWHRKAWASAGADSVLDLRQHGYWIENLLQEKDSLSPGQANDQME